MALIWCMSSLKTSKYAEKVLAPEYDLNGLSRHFSPILWALSLGQTHIWAGSV